MRLSLFSGSVAPIVCLLGLSLPVVTMNAAFATTYNCGKDVGGIYPVQLEKTEGRERLFLEGKQVPDDDATYMAGGNFEPVDLYVHLEKLDPDRIYLFYYRVPGVEVGEATTRGTINILGKLFCTKK